LCICSELVKLWYRREYNVLRKGISHRNGFGTANYPFDEGAYVDTPPPPEVYRQLGAWIVELHPMTLIQNARPSGGGVVQNVPHEAVTIGPVETWKAETVSIWIRAIMTIHLASRLSALMISKRIVDSSVPMSFLADHEDCRPFARIRRAEKRLRM